MIHLLDQSFVLEKPAEIKETELNPANLAHLKALRPDVGESITFVDLKGKAAKYLVAAIKPLVLHFKEMTESADTSTKTHLYLCPPLGSALDQAIEQATEVGFDTVQFLRSDHVQFPKQKELGIARLSRVAQASCLQSGRLWAPIIHQQWLGIDEALAMSSNTYVVCADESSAQKVWGSSDGKRNDRGNRAVSIFIGPEGGWSPREREIFKVRSNIFSLGPHVLRVPTAVVAAYVLTWKELTHG